MQTSQSDSEKTADDSVFPYVVAVVLLALPVLLIQEIDVMEVRFALTILSALVVVWLTYEIGVILFRAQKSALRRRLCFAFALCPGSLVVLLALAFFLWVWRLASPKAERPPENRIPEIEQGDDALIRKMASEILAERKKEQEKEAAQKENERRAHLLKKLSALSTEELRRFVDGKP